MKRLCSLKYVWLVCLFLLMPGSAADGKVSGIINAWEPFETKTELASYVAGVDADKDLSARDEFTQMDKIIPIYHDTADRKDQGALNGFKIHNVTISFSRALMDQLKVDIRQPAENENEKLNTIKSLPSTFLNSSYKDTFESLGKIFEPQVNLSIEF